MGNNLPHKISETGIAAALARWCNQIVDYLKRNKLRSSSDILIQETSEGTTLTLASKIKPFSVGGTSTGGTQTQLQQFVFINDAGDYLVAKTFNGTVTGSGKCYIAKPGKLRNSIVSEINKGTTHTFTYDPPVHDTGSFYTRTDTWGGNSEAQIIVPSYNNLDVFYAFPVSQSVPGYGSVADIGGIINTGSGYATNNVLTVAGGAYLTPATIKVTSVNGGGGITGYALSGSGKYVLITPTSPNAPSGGGGSGAQFSILINPANMIDVNIDGRAWAH